MPSPDRHAIVHIGSHKTATTLIQRWLLANHDRLLERGWWYPDLTEVVPDAVDFTQWDLFAAVATNETSSRLGEGGLDTATRLLGQWRAPRMLLSAENCWGLPPQPTDDAAYWQRKTSFARDAIGVLRECGAEQVTVVAYVRRPDEYLLSLFNQMVKQRETPVPDGDLSEAFRRFARDNAALVHNDAQLRAWRSALRDDERLAVRSFGRGQLIGDDPVTDFARTVGLDTDGLAEPVAERANESWSAAALMVKGAANRHFSSRDQSIRARRRMEGASGQRLLGRDLRHQIAPHVLDEVQDHAHRHNQETLGVLGDPVDWSRRWSDTIDPSARVRADDIAILAGDVLANSIRRPKRAAEAAKGAEAATTTDGAGGIAAAAPVDRSHRVTDEAVPSVASDDEGGA